ncbi:hypothetical protein JTB14_031153 [Gonioctena quinquepunctata]|nr:hypothetical protein JTB14_031153 [Gonioctena quinquepunctata]
MVINTRVVKDDKVNQDVKTNEGNYLLTVDIMKQVIANELEKCTKTLLEEISIIRNEVQVVKSTTIDIIRLLSDSKASSLSISKETMNDIEADISFNSDLSGKTMIEKKKICKKRT